MKSAKNTSNKPQSGLSVYQTILKECESTSAEAVTNEISKKLPHFWRDAYIAKTMRPTDIVVIKYHTFDYIYDHYPVLQPKDSEPCNNPSIEPRLVAVFGRSAPHKRARDDYRLKGWVGATEKTFGLNWDKGHFIAHSIGGAVDGLEANVFVQRRDLNRGWSAEGKKFREMENYCASNPNTFCFCRPFYGDQSARPAFLEFGVLKKDLEFWVGCFDNR